LVGVAILAPRTEQYLGVAVSQRMTYFFLDNFWLMLSLELIVGVSISIVCSLISIRKNLKV